MKKLILASTSPTRKELLAKAGLTFEVVASNYEEDMTLDMPPEELVQFLAKGKAESVVKDFPQAVIIGADTIIYSEGKILGKPHTKEKAKEMLQGLSGKGHSAITGYAVIDKENNKTFSKFVETKVFFRNIPEEELDVYVATGESLDKAGAYAILQGGNSFVERVEGDVYNVAGLPLAELLATLKEFGVEV